MACAWEPHEPPPKPPHCPVAGSALIHRLLSLALGEACGDRQVPALGREPFGMNRREGP